MDARIGGKFVDSMQSLYKEFPGLNDKGVQSLKETFASIQGETYDFCFVNFNYTNTLDRIISIANNVNPGIGTHFSAHGNKKNTLKAPLHIHGTLENGMILGVNDASQIINPQLNSNPDLLEVMVKERMNSAMGNSNTEKLSSMIDHSRVIYIYGLSTGKTDIMWLKKIVSWLRSNVKNKLVIFYYGHEEEIKNNLPEVTIPLIRKLKKEFLSNAGLDSDEADVPQIMDRIFIIFNSDIFDFSGILA